MEFITGKQAQLMLNITTRQGLYKIVKNFNVEVKKVGDGLPNLYSKQDIERYMTEHKEDRKIPKKSKKAVKKQKKTIEKLKSQVVELKDNKPPLLEYENKNINKDHEDFTPLNAIGQEEYLRVEQLLKENGTFETVDQSLLLVYAISYQKYINAVTMSAQCDDTTMDDFGTLRIHPYFQVADKCITHMMKIADKLGIGARSRIGLEIKKEHKKGIFDILNEKEEF